ncbi:TetR/AcrR family transcriptional regulator [Actinophytocola gossypii]|uniref:TetR family transcriptional regulator n=1 Tax=Actinophytocola gossypii TaxID=2812003 RepID=A0ABT2JJA8_9PSEU|nr:TetR/AcrR family transcriptional regulator [Actinophytocola gossypii]MCT2587961.1 TetR family transcriptional regulator [Actinophytocola gossypii]
MAGWVHKYKVLPAWLVPLVAVGVIVLIAAAVSAVLLWLDLTGLTSKDRITVQLDALKIGLSVGVGSGGVFALYLATRRQRTTEHDPGTQVRRTAGWELLAFTGGARVPDKRLRPRKVPGQQRALETRQRLLDAAARVFATHGYAAGTTNRIAEEAGHSVGSLYQYFPNKDGILVELSTAHARSGIAAVERLIADGRLPDSIEGRIRLFVRAVMDNHRDDPALHRVLFDEAPRPPELLAYLRDAERRLVAAAERMLTADQDVTVEDVPMAARLVVGAIESLVHRFHAGADPSDADRFERELVAMLLRYLTTPADL